MTPGELAMHPRAQTLVDIDARIATYIAAQPERKRTELETLHRRILSLMPGCRLWFLDGMDQRGKVVSNPSIGYGAQVTSYANGGTREFYQIGVSANTTGLSIYIMGLDDRTYLRDTYAATIGKATVTGYCIRFRSLEAIDLDVLDAAMRDGIARSGLRAPLAP